MRREHVVAKLRAHEGELRAFGVFSVSIFGSVARDEPITNDVDLAVRLDKTFSRGGFDYFGRLEDLEQALSRILGTEVDVIEEPVRKHRLQAEIDKDRILAF